MLISGSGGGQSVLGAAGTHECPACGQTSSFSAVCNYEYAHLWWLCSMVTKRNYFLKCDNCQSLTPVEKSAIREQFPKDNIPFLRRRGWMIFAAIVAVIVAVIFFESARGKQRADERFAQFIAEPRIGDVLLINLSYVPNSGFGPDVYSHRRAWGTLKLVEMDGDEMFFATSTKAWEESSDLRSNYRSVEYDMSDLVYVEKELVSRFKELEYVLDTYLVERK